MTNAEAAERFAACLAQVLRHEGGYVEHKSDPGGATNMGITHKTLARWRQISPWWKLDKSEVRALEPSEAENIYRALYWDAIGAEKMPAGLDLALFDYAVNSGPARAVKALQTLLGVVADGYVGPLTLAALTKRGVGAALGQLIEAICAQRLGFLQGLANFSVFGAGWRRRVNDVRATALTMAALTPVVPSTFQPKGSEMMSFLQGYRSYVIAGVMIVVGLAQMAGIDIPAIGEHASGQLILEALAVIFLRKGIRSDIANT